jgi:hypothetical protein
MREGLRNRPQRGCLSEQEASDFVRGALGPKEIDTVEGHLDECPACLGLIAAVAQSLDSHASAVSAVPMTALPSTEAPAPAVDRTLFLGTSRFRVVRHLGAGGMGVVYEAFDREHGKRVALKLIPARAPDALVRFKNEFRSLQDIQHPNLVRMGELFIQHDQWFFTMELVEGVSFLRYVRRASRTPGEHDVVDEPRLRSALRQLTAGLNALHASGKVHRDIKPRNVLVTAEGRLVILDFGLAQAWEESPEFTDVRVAGTIAYMAPEQTASRPAGPPADWYSVGTMMFEALTGRLPFAGTPLEILEAKQRNEPPRVESFDRSIPGDLASLCNQLVRPNPEERPDGATVLRRLGASPEAPRRFAALPSSKIPRFVGRADELRQLWDASRTSMGGRAAVVLVEGESGIGKTELVRRFAEQLRLTRPNVLILAGRCYERESVAYKAFDGILDELTHWLTRLPSDEVASLLSPSTTALLAQAFPMLARLDAGAASAPADQAALDPHERRRRLFSALRDLFKRLSDRQPVVVVIDDLQWADADSSLLLAELMRDPDPPAMLLLATLRRGERDPIPAVPALPRTLQGLGDKLRTLRLGPLAPTDAKTLAAALLQRTASAAALDARQLAAEARGHPLYIDELVRYHVAHGATAAHASRLEDVLWSRIAVLDEPTRRLLAAVSVAGGPVAQQVAGRATDLAANELDRALTGLRVEHLARTTGADRADLVECYHDRVRKAVLAHLTPPMRREQHQQLAVALETWERADPEALAAHWRGAGDLPRTARYTVLAADRAASALAFDRAAALYRTALELQLPRGDHETHILRVKLGDAVVNAGRGVDAAEVYQAAAAGATETEALALKRRAAEQLLRSGHIDRAFELYETIGRAFGLRLAATPLRAVASLLYQRVRIRLRGLGFVERSEADVPRRTLDRIDATFFVGLGLATVDTVRGIELSMRRLRETLDAGEPYRIARALALEASINASAYAARGHERTAALVGIAHGIAERIDQPHALGLAAWAAGASAYLEGRWRDGHERNEQALAIFRGRCTGVFWEAASAEAFSLWSLFYLGELAEIGRRLPALIKQARDRSDLYDATNLRASHTNIWWLVTDDPERAAAEAIDAVREWSPKAFHLQHYYELHALTECDLYRGWGVAAHERVHRGWPELGRAYLFQVRTIKLEMLFLRARTALTLARSSATEGPRALALAAADARRLEAAKMPWTTALAALVRAGVAVGQGRRDSARQLYRDAARQLDAAEMRLHAACARRRHGQLFADGDGAKLVDEAEAWMRAQGVVNPSRLSAVIAPCAIG